MGIMDVEVMIEEQERQLVEAEKEKRKINKKK
jgi:hypothetical protein